MKAMAAGRDQGATALSAETRRHGENMPGRLTRLSAEQRYIGSEVPSLRVSALPRLELTPRSRFILDHMAASYIFRSFRRCRCSRFSSSCNEPRRTRPLFHRLPEIVIQSRFSALGLLPG